MAPTARVVGPVFLGDRCRLEDGAMIIGPTILGNGCRVGKGSWVARTVAPDNTVFANRARVTDQFLPAGRRRVIRQTMSGQHGTPDRNAGPAQRLRRNAPSLGVGVVGATIASLAAALARKCGL
jgi:hypothetical protein